MGFSDAEIVALSGAHALGRCHPTSSGFAGPWTFSPTTLSNDYFKRLLEETWVEKKWAGPRQFEDAKTRALMMLPSDLALIEDAAMRAHVEAFARDQAKFVAAFAAAFVKLGELGVKFAPGAAPMTFKRA
jgi:cytochrome c peroxidase